LALTLKNGPFPLDLWILQPFTSPPYILTKREKMSIEITLDQNTMETILAEFIEAPLTGYHCFSVTMDVSVDENGHPTNEVIGKVLFKEENDKEQKNG